MPCFRPSRDFPHAEQRVHLNRNLIREFLEKVPGILSKRAAYLNWKPHIPCGILMQCCLTICVEGYLDSLQNFGCYGHQTTLGGSGSVKPWKRALTVAAPTCLCLLRVHMRGLTCMPLWRGCRGTGLLPKERNTGVTRPSGLRNGKGSGEGIDGSAQGVKSFIESGWYNASAALNSNNSCGTAALVGWEEVKNHGTSSGTWRSIYD